MIFSLLLWISKVHYGMYALEETQFRIQWVLSAISGRAAAGALS
jgi:hypothetical protein